MGKILHFIIKFGATGSTARWVAKRYLFFKNKGVVWTDGTKSTICENIIRTRYVKYTDHPHQKTLLERVPNMKGLTDLTFSILQIEGAIKTNAMDMGMQMQVIHVIMEELYKAGLSEEEVGKIS